MRTSDVEIVCPETSAAARTTSTTASTVSPCVAFSANWNRCDESPPIVRRRLSVRGSICRTSFDTRSRKGADTRFSSVFSSSAICSM